VVSKRQAEEGFYTNVRAGYGSYSTFIQGVEHGGKVGNTDYYVLQSFRSSSGHRDFSSGELQEYFARVGHQIHEAWTMSLTANATNISPRTRGLKEIPRPARAPTGQTTK
jgi:iron complex outermembrane receptor protein